MTEKERILWEMNERMWAYPETIEPLKSEMKLWRSTRPGEMDVQTLRMFQGRLEALIHEHEE